MDVTATLGSGQILMNWTASTDNVGVTLYKIHFGNSIPDVGTSFTNSYTIASAKSGTTYTLRVQACDAAGNCSLNSSKVSVVVPSYSL